MITEQRCSICSSVIRDKEPVAEFTERKGGWTARRFYHTRYQDCQERIRWDDVAYSRSMMPPMDGIVRKAIH